MFWYHSLISILVGLFLSPEETLHLCLYDIYIVIICIELLLYCFEATIRVIEMILLLSAAEKLVN